MDTYTNTVITYAEAEGMTDPLDAEIAMMDMLTGDPCTACGLPTAVMDIDGITCTCELPTFTERGPVRGLRGAPLPAFPDGDVP